MEIIMHDGLFSTGVVLTLIGGGLLIPLFTGNEADLIMGVSVPSSLLTIGILTMAFAKVVGVLEQIRDRLPKLKSDEEE